MPKILYLITEDWFFVSHFLPMARAAQEAGFEIVVATRVDCQAERIEREGFRVVPVAVRRFSIGLVEVFKNLVQTVRVVRAERPDIVHCIALRPVVLGGIAACWAGVPRLVLAPTGLGALWADQGFGSRVLRGIIRWIVGRWLRKSGTHYLFENRDDPIEFGIDPDGPDTTVVGGAGVDPADFPFVTEPPSPPVKVAVVARMIWPKGIGEAVEAVRRARALGAPVELHLFGDPDPSNRLSVPGATLRAWGNEPGVHWHGRTNDVAEVWRTHHVGLFLSSYREGVPRTLIETAAAGRPIVTTDAPGCRDVVRDGQEGFLVKVGDVEAAARALVRLAGDAALRLQMGTAAHQRFQDRFTEAMVQRTVVDLYRSALLAGDAIRQ